LLLDANIPPLSEATGVKKGGAKQFYMLIPPYEIAYY